MELRNVRAFLAAARERHFGRAAAGLNLTQPALTLRIQVLERELGIQLLQRNSRGVRLTPAGEALLEHANSLVHEEDQTLREMKDYAAGIAGRLRISYLTVWNIGLPTNLVAEFRRRYPQVRLETTSGYSQSNVKRLIAGEVDFAFVGMPSADRDGVVTRPLDRQEIVLVMTPTNPLAELKVVPLDRLRGVPMIAVSSALRSPHVATSLGWLANHLGEAPNVVAEEPVDQIAAAVAHSGTVVSFTTAPRARLWEAEGLISRRLSPIPLVDYGVAYRQDDASPALANMLCAVDDVAPPFSDEVPAGCELVWTRRELDSADTRLSRA
jgi:DNA-binding transcriptional LysR family regulator